MSHRIVAAPLALVFLSGPAWAQDDPQTVGVSVGGTLVEVSVEVAVQACGVDAETLLAEWNALGTELDTMADTSVQADATDLAPAVEVDTQMDSAIDGQTGADATSESDGDAALDLASDVNAAGASAEGVQATDAETTADASATADDGAVGQVQSTMADTDPSSAPGVPEDGSMDAGVEATAQAGAAGDDPATADIATKEEIAAAGSEQTSTDGPATPTEGTTLSKAAVCEISAETADTLGISVPG